MREGKLPDYMMKKVFAGIERTGNPEHPQVLVRHVAQTLADAEDGALVVHRAMNRLYEQGAEPFGMSVSVLLPQTVSERTIKCLMRSIAAAGSAHGARIMDRDVSVSNDVEKIAVSISACGYFTEGNAELVDKIPLQKKKAENASKDIPDFTEQKDRPNIGKKTECGHRIRYVVQTRFAGMIGSLLLARDGRRSLETRYTPEFLDGCKEFADHLSIKKDAEISVALGADMVLECYEGGIFGALWELGEAMDSGMEIDLPAILLRQETIEICEYFDVSPYQLWSGGSALIVTEKPQELVHALAEEEIFAACIGRLTAGNDRVIKNQGEVRYLEPPRLDEYRKAKSKC